MLKRVDLRILVGVLLIIGGALAILDQLGYLRGATDYFWAGIFAIGAVVFLIWFFSDRSKWWSAIPGFTLAGIAVSLILPNQWGLDGLAVLGGIGVGFWVIYFWKHARWWAIIPGGVMISLGIISALAATSSAFNAGGAFLLGLGVTFLLVAWLAHMRWAYIPAAVLFLIGFFIGAPFSGVYEYVWIGLLLLAGVILLIGGFRK